jgi:ring-1,2-phenylacetyl-CoA epoxidase subunit PaaB
LNSLDPRVNRLPLANNPDPLEKAPLDQFTTYEVFVQPRDGKPFQHEGAVHAPDIELAFVLAKETFTRRFTCSSLFVVDTRDIFVSPMTEGNQSVYELIPDIPSEKSSLHTFEIFHLTRRGKQHTQAGQVQAADGGDALRQARRLLSDPSVAVFNVWAIRQDTIRFTHDHEKDLWTTLPEKKFRDASAYKAGDKLNAFLQKS